MDQKTKLCPHCKKEVDVQASRCPHCHGKIYVWTITKKIILGGIILIVVLVAGLDSSTPTPVVSQVEQIASLKKNDFAKLAKMNVEIMLKSPSTAKFNTSPTVKLEDKTYSIDSWVDSQNSYGATVRSYWSAKAHYIGKDTEEETGTGSNWIIDEFIFDGEKVK